MYLVDNMFNIPLVNLKKQYKAIEKEINGAINNTIINSNFILGPEIKKFEEDYADFCNAKHCISVSSGTSALQLALQASGIKPKDEVITVPNTFMATVEAIIDAGAKPIFVEIDEDTFNIDTKKLKSLITEKTKAIIPVDLYGQPCDLDPIMELAEKHNLTVIEDACQAHGAEYKSKAIGSISHITAFSFYPGKNLGAYGDAGAITTNNVELAEKIKVISNHGRLKGEKYRHDYLGGNYRMDELQAAILNVKLKHLKDWVNSRRKVASKYNELIKPNVKIPKEADFAKHAYHLYVIRANKRERLKEFLNSKNISTGVHYPIPLHLQPSLKFLGYKKQNFKITEDCADTILSLPTYPELEDAEIEFISDNINKFFEKDIK